MVKHLSQTFYQWQGGTTDIADNSSIILTKNITDENGIKIDSEKIFNRSNDKSEYQNNS